MSVSRFLTRLEERVRSWLSHYPVAYALLGGVGIVLFWRGVWLGADVLSALYFQDGHGVASIDIVPSLLDPVLSLIIGSVILLICGLWVSSLLGNEVIISGLRGEKRLTERTETEVRTETGALAEVLEQLDIIHSKLEELDVKRGRAKKAVPPKPALMPPPLPPKAAAKK